MGSVIYSRDLQLLIYKHIYMYMFMYECELYTMFAPNAQRVYLRNAIKMSLWRKLLVLVMIQVCKVKKKVCIIM